MFRLEKYVEIPNLAGSQFLTMPDYLVQCDELRSIRCISLTAAAAVLSKTKLNFPKMQAFPRIAFFCRQT